MTGQNTGAYKHVQGLSRGLAILRALNRAEGNWASIRELSEATGLHRTTVRRLLETLQAEGLVRRSPSDDSYRLTLEVRALSEGFTDDEWISQVASPVLGELLQKVVWPSDLTTLDGLTMRIRETTHRFSPLSFHRAMVRRCLPLLTTAAGRAYLAFCPDAEREDLLDRLEETFGGLPESTGGRRALVTMLEKCRAAGYASNLGEWETEQKFVALAVPVLRGRKVAGCINIVMLKQAVSIEQAKRQHLATLQNAARKIERHLNDSDGHPAAAPA